MFTLLRKNKIKKKINLKTAKSPRRKAPCYCSCCSGLLGLWLVHRVGGERGEGRRSGSSTLRTSPTRPPPGRCHAGRSGAGPLSGSAPFLPEPAPWAPKSSSNFPAPAAEGWKEPVTHGIPVEFPSCSEILVVFFLLHFSRRDNIV